ncbi:MAG: CPBP family intramembrane metalloprotease, partial [Clostridia bacterium]|nr:CPBP family intramembrane metalloprotease [Clostridia bacterium]
ASKEIPMEKKLRPLHALILFGIFLIFMPTVGARLQAKLGLGGVAITEFCLLSLAVLFPRALDIELKDVFCMTPPPVSRFFAALALSFGTLLLTTSIDRIQAYFLSGAAKSDQALSNLVASSSPVLAVIVVAILPAICEELLFRGAIMSALRPLKRTWLILLLVGLQLPALLSSALTFTFYPNIRSLPTSPAAILAYISYGALVLTPSAIECIERAKWKYFVSKI